jgi:hypothetical protein
MEKKNSRYPPAVLKYRKTHPTVGFVLTDDLKALLDKVKGNLSYGEYVKSLLNEDLNLSKDTFQNGYERGFAEAKKQYRIWINCYVCGKPITIAPRSPAHDTIIELMDDEDRWGHPRCISEYNRG